jgi:hypothetical protein
MCSTPTAASANAPRDEDQTLRPAAHRPLNGCRPTIRIQPWRSETRSIPIGLRCGASCGRLLQQAGSCQPRVPPQHKPDAGKPQLMLSLAAHSERRPPRGRAGSARGSSSLGDRTDPDSRRIGCSSSNSAGLSLRRRAPPGRPVRIGPRWPVVRISSRGRPSGLSELVRLTDDGGAGNPELTAAPTRWRQHHLVTTARSWSRPQP